MKLLILLLTLALFPAIFFLACAKYCAWRGKIYINQKRKPIAKWKV